MPWSRILRMMRDQLLDVRRGQPRGRFVEQQQLRVERQRPRDLEQPLLAVGQVARFLGGQVLQADEVAAGPAPAARAARVLAPVARRHAAPTSARLRGTCDAAPTSTFCSAVISPNSCTFWKVRAMPDSAMSRRGRARPASGRRSSSAPGGRHVDAGQHVHHRALARAVRPDQAVDRAAPHRQVDVVQRLQAAELHQHAARVAGPRPAAGCAVAGESHRHGSPRPAPFDRDRALGRAGSARCARSRRCRPAGSTRRTA